MTEIEDRDLNELIGLAVEGLGVAISIIDIQGTLLYYNQRAAEILDRKPEYLGRDIHSHHKKAASNAKIGSMMQAFLSGRTEPFHYEATPYGKTILVTLSPIRKDGRLVGCTQSVQLKEELELN
jgi:PAS domain-containing protein